jgi:hypothetical protein
MFHLQFFISMAKPMISYILRSTGIRHCYASGMMQTDDVLSASPRRRLQGGRRRQIGGSGEDGPTRRAVAVAVEKAA